MGRIGVLWRFPVRQSPFGAVAARICPSLTRTSTTANRLGVLLADAILALFTRPACAGPSCKHAGRWHAPPLRESAGQDRARPPPLPDARGHGHLDDGHVRRSLRARASEARVYKGLGVSPLGRQVKDPSSRSWRPLGARHGLFLYAHTDAAGIRSSSGLPPCAGSGRPGLRRALEASPVWPTYPALMIGCP